MFSPYSVPDLKEVCARLRILPSRDRGQNFLIDQSVAKAMVDASNIGKTDHGIEIGPGLGALTFLLSEKALRVTAIEIEPKLARFLREELARQDIKNIEVLEGDAMRIIKVSPARFFGATVVTSLPYSITGDFFSGILQDHTLPKRMVLLVQKEVAERLIAKPPHLSLLSVVASWYGRVELLRVVPKSAFWPQPAVESAIISIDAEDEAVRARRRSMQSQGFFAYVRQAFKYPRKKIMNTVKILGDRDKAVSERRPGELTLDDWIALYSYTNKANAGVLQASNDIPS